MESFLNDLKYSLRGFRQNPGFALTVIATLALGLGANTAIFTVVRTVILHSLPYPDSDRIVEVRRPGGGSISEPLFAYIARNNPGFEDLAAYHAGARMSLDSGNKSQLVDVVTTSCNYFRLFGAHPVLGRVFTAADDAPGPPVLVLSYGLWQRMGADPSIPGKGVVLGGAPYSVAGVLSQGFQPYPPADVWVPLKADPNSTNQAGVLTVSGRLPAGTPISEANAKLAVVISRYPEAHPRQLRIDSGIRASSLERQITGDVRPALLILLGAVGLVLLIACANVANLLLARATARRREMAIRAALGAARGRIVRQLLTECLLLAMAGGAVGLALGSLAVRALLAFTPGDLPRLQEIAALPVLDPGLAAYTILLAALTAVLFGVTPAFYLARTELTAAMNESGGRAGAGRKQNRTHSVLAAAEMALAVVLLCGALLLIRSLLALHSVDLGFNPHNLLTMEISLAGRGYSQSSAVSRVARHVVERVERIPGVECAALASALPLWGKMDMIFNIPGRIPAGRQSNGDVQWRFVSAHYFDALQVPLLYGRRLRDREAGRTVVISEAMARKFWPGQSPVGQSIFIGPGLGPAYQVGVTEVVGVVGDVRERLYFDPQPVMYQSPSQIPDADMALLNSYEPAAILVRTRPGVAPMSIGKAAREALGLPVAKVRTMEQVGFDSTARQNFNTLLLGTFALMALLLAAVGIYGVMSYGVERRTHEIGIRAALGANRGDTLRLVFLQVSRMSVAGIACGIAASFWLTNLIGAQLFGVRPSDPLTFVAVPLILLAVALMSAFFPALRATRIDPLTALRHE